MGRMRLLVIADIHGDHELLSTLLTPTTLSSIDAIVCPGDFTNQYTTPPEFNQLDIAELIVEKLLATGKPLLCVPGNHDPYDILEIFHDYGISCHGRIRTVNGVHFTGFGGALTPFGTAFEPPEEETRAALESVAAKAEDPLVLITHAPPKNTALDALPDGSHVGSDAIRSIIALRKPLLALSAHIQESRGTDRIGPTTLFYPGALIDGFYGIVTLDLAARAVRCEQKTLPVPKRTARLLIDQTL